MPTTRGMRSLMQRKKRGTSSSSAAAAESSASAASSAAAPVAEEAASSAAAANAVSYEAPTVASEEALDEAVAAPGNDDAAVSPLPQQAEVTESSPSVNVTARTTETTETVDQTNDAAPQAVDSSAAAEAPRVPHFARVDVPIPEAEGNESDGLIELDDAIIDVPFTPLLSHATLPTRVVAPRPNASLPSNPLDRRFIPSRPAPPPPVRPPRPAGTFGIPGAPPATLLSGIHLAPLSLNSPVTPYHPGHRRTYNEYMGTSFPQFPTTDAPPVLNGRNGLPSGVLPSGELPSGGLPSAQLSPMHHNQLLALDQRRTTPWDLPGTDRFPRLNNTRIVDGRWMGGKFEQVRVGGMMFTVPMRLVQKYQFWAMLTTLQRPPEGFTMPDVPADIFSVLLECVYSTGGLDGTELGLNLIKIAHAIVLAWKWGMTGEKSKLEDTARRYIARRIMFRNPHGPDRERIMEHNYFVYRSEEIYRTWELAQRYPELDKEINSVELISLYSTTIPHEFWPVLTSTFKPDFTTLINTVHSVRQFPAAESFEEWWFRFYRQAGYLQYDWYDAAVMDRLVLQRNRRDNEDDHPVPLHARAEFEAARARGDALMAAYDAQQHALRENDNAPPDFPPTPDRAQDTWAPVGDNTVNQPAGSETVSPEQPPHNEDVSAPEGAAGDAQGDVAPAA